MAETITQQQYETAYRVGLDHHDGKFGISDAVRRLVPTGLNPSSAASLVYSVSRLLKGVRYTRALSVPVTDDYLTWILRDRGPDALGSAIEALSQHIDYFEKKRNTHCLGLRELVTKHSAFLGNASTASILIEWKDQVSSGFVDVLPLEWFQSEGHFSGKIHDVLEPRGTRCSAMCDVTVRGMTADLDFGVYPDFNKSHDLLLGVARIEFEDNDRTSIGAMYWKELGSEEFKSCPFEVRGFQLPTGTEYQPPVEASDKTARMVRDRPGQPKFRSDVRSVYGNCCCITGCSIPAVLECAHIDPYLAPGSDNTRNGLLLRADIHTLFDRHLISIDPDTLKIHVSARIRVEGGYGYLHEKFLRLPKDKSHHPDKGALARHLKRFHKSHENP